LEITDYRLVDGQSPSPASTLIASILLTSYNFRFGDGPKRGGYMQRLASSYRFVGFFALLTTLILALASCGGGSSSSSSSSSAGNTLVIIPSKTSNPVTSISLNFGDVTGVFADLRNSSGTSVTLGTITWTTDAPTAAGVTINGAVCGDATTKTTCICGGQWQNTNVDCIAPSATTTATITATASTGETASIKVFVHPRVARVNITTPSTTDCTSSTGTVQLTAQALDSNGNPITVGNDATAFNWFSGDASIATVNSNGLVTAASPGKGSIFVTVQNQTSSAYPFNTCAVKSISAHVTGVTDTSFTADASTTKALVADVVDTKGKTITVSSSRLTWASNRAGLVAVDQTGSATTTGAGRAGIVVSCSPPQCNSGLTSVFSNLVTANVNGTRSTQVLAANSSGTSLVPIDTSTNTAGTAITLPFNPNSLVYAPNGAKAYLGSASNLMVYDPTASTVTSLSNLPGTVQAVSNNGQYVVVFENSTNNVTVYDATSNIIRDRFSVAGVPNPCKTATFDKCPHASFTPDNQTTFVVGGPNLYVSNPNASLKTIPLGTTGNDIAVSAQGSFAFVANSDSTVVPFATCNNSKVPANVATTTAAAQRIFSSIDGTAIYAIAPPNLNIISPTTNAVGCVPSLIDPLSSVDLGQGAFNVQQPILSTRGDRLYFITGGNNVVLYDTASNAGSVINLAASANGLSGGLTSDGKSLYVGGSDNTIHRLDTSTNTDAGQTSVSFTPDLVAVRPL
jgi:hypothetical protein